MYHNMKTYLVITLVIMFFVSLSLAGCGRGDTQLEVNINEMGNMAVEGITTGEPEEAAGVIHILVEEAHEIISGSEDYIILDVRSQQEYGEGHIKDAILIPVDELEERLDEIPAGKSIITYCRSGRRSASAADILVKNGFTPVYNMEGGILEWESKGYPTVEDN